MQTTECRSETGLGLNTTLPLTLVTTQAQENTVTAVTSQQKMNRFVGFSKNGFGLSVKCSVGHEWAVRKIQILARVVSVGVITFTNYVNM